MKIIKGEIYKPCITSVFEYDKPTGEKPKVEKEPQAKWVGALFPYDKWKEIIGFFYTQYEKTKSEAMVRGYYSEEKKEWRIHAFPQEYDGFSLAVTDTTDEKQFQEYIGDGFILALTVHHHCDISAFQSGADHRDEGTKQGVHITIGKLKDKILDFHCRISIGKKMYKASIFDFVEVPYFHLSEADLTPEFMKSYEETMLGLGGEFPAIWLENMKKKEWKPEVYSTDRDSKFEDFRNRNKGAFTSADAIDLTGDTAIYSESDLREQLECELETIYEQQGDRDMQLIQLADDPTLSAAERLEMIKEMIENPELTYH